MPHLASRVDQISNFLSVKIFELLKGNAVGVAHLKKRHPLKWLLGYCDTVQWTKSARSF
jgi:hypothetical protein